MVKRSLSTHKDLKEVHLHFRTTSSPAHFIKGSGSRELQARCPWVGGDGTDGMGNWRHLQLVLAVRWQRGRNTGRIYTNGTSPPLLSQHLGQALKLLEGLEKWKSKVEGIWVREFKIMTMKTSELLKGL